MEDGGLGQRVAEDKRLITARRWCIAWHGHRTVDSWLAGGRRKCGEGQSRERRTWMDSTAMFSPGSHFHASRRPMWNLAKFLRHANATATSYPSRHLFAGSQTVAIIAPLHLSARLSDWLRCAMSIHRYRYNWRLHSTMYLEGSQPAVPAS